MHSGARTQASNRWTRVGTIARQGCSIGAQVHCRPHNVNLPTHPFRFPCHCVHVHYVRVPGDGPAWFGWLVLAIQRVPHVRYGPHDAHLTTGRFTLHYQTYGHATAVMPRYGTCPTMTYLRCCSIALFSPFCVIICALKARTQSSAGSGWGALLLPL